MSMHHVIMAHEAGKPKDVQRVVNSPAKLVYAYGFLALVNQASVALLYLAHEGSLNAIENANVAMEALPRRESLGKLHDDVFGTSGEQ